MLFTQSTTKLEKHTTVHHVNVGKTYGFGTPILLSDGSTKLVENLRLDETVVGLDGLPKKIIEIHQGEGQLYKISQENGVDYVTNGLHELVLKFYNTSSIKWIEHTKSYHVNYIENLEHKVNIFCPDPHTNLTESNRNNMYIRASDFLKLKWKEESTNCDYDTLIISVEDYLKLSNNVKKSLYGFKQCVDFKETPIKLEGYMLGVWLCGNSNCAEVSSTDEKMVKYFVDFGLQNYLKVTKINQTYRFSTMFGANSHDKLTLALRHYNLVLNKHIPKEYLFNSRQIRLELLAGIIDGCGSLKINTSPHTTEIYKLKILSDNLAMDIIFLARSLGFQVINTNIKVMNDNTEETINKIYISGNNLCSIPSLLERKRAKKTKTKYSSLFTKISVTKIERGKFAGFQIEGDGKFIGTDFTVMHNSTFSNI